MKFPFLRACSHQCLWRSRHMLRKERRSKLFGTIPFATLCTVLLQMVFCNLSLKSRASLALPLVDVTIPDWKHRDGLAIDVAVTSPLTKTSVRLVDPCED